MTERFIPVSALVLAIGVSHPALTQEVAPADDQTSATPIFSCADLNDLEPSDAEIFLQGFSQGYAAAGDLASGSEDAAVPEQDENDEVSVIDGVPNTIEESGTVIGTQGLLDTNEIIEGCRSQPEAVLVDVLER